MKTISLQKFTAKFNHKIKQNKAFPANIPGWISHRTSLPPHVPYTGPKGFNFITFSALALTQSELKLPFRHESRENHVMWFGNLKQFFESCYSFKWIQKCYHYPLKYKKVAQLSVQSQENTKSSMNFCFRDCFETSIK